MLNTTSGPKARRYVFSVFIFDVESGELTRNRHTERIRTQTSRLLTILLERAGTVVSRDELREQMWPNGEFLDHERSINRAVNELREILRDDPRDPKFIETLPKRGYRFRSDVKMETAATPDTPASALPDPLPEPAAEPASEPIPPQALPVVKPEPAPAASLRPHRWVIATTALLVLAAAALIAWSALWPGFKAKPPTQSKVVRMAIVPFDVQGEGAGPQAESFRLDLMDTIAQLPNVELHTAHSLDHGHLDDAALENLARVLQLDMLLLGHFVVQDNYCTLQMELVRARDMAHLASFQYKSPRDGLFRVRNDLRRDIFNELQLAGKPQSVVRGSTQDAQAYNNYLKARELAGRNNVETLPRALDLYQSAIDRDPGFAMAYAGMAGAHLALSDSSGFAAHLPLAKHTAEQALEHDPNLAEAHAVLGGVAFRLDWNPARSEAELRRAVDLEPHNASYHGWLAETLVSMGRFDEGLQQVDLARTEDPLWPQVYVIDVFSSGVAHHPARMIAAAKTALELFPRSTAPHDLLAWSYMTAGRYKEASDEWRAMAVMEKDDARVALEDKSRTALQSGGLKAWAFARVRAIEAHDKGTLRHPNDFDPAEWYTAAGDRDKALAELRQMVDRHDNACTAMAVNPMFYPLHHDPEFLKLLARIGLAPPPPYPSSAPLKEAHTAAAR
jgi:DNA-binding winged helix-turn-helix (wHTH) protein/Tfp pilus assembly protein PilF/TolB-like protein